MSPSSVNYVSRSGAITTGGVAQTIAAANPQRRGFFIQNLSTGDLWFSLLGTAAAAAPSFKIVPDAIYEAPYGGVATGAISIFGATTGQAFSAVEY